jgi:hypothetical protein
MKSFNRVLVGVALRGHPVGGLANFSKDECREEGAATECRPYKLKNV